jgi:hypothetical protein
VPVLFVSSSVPIPTLRNYAVELEKVHGVMAFRGVPGGLHKMGPMAKLTAQILRLDPGCEGRLRDAQRPAHHRSDRLSPTWDRPGPALAMVPGDPTQAYCERDDESPARRTWFRRQRASGMFEEYARLGGKEEVSHAQALLDAR